MTDTTPAPLPQRPDAAVTGELTALALRPPGYGWDRPALLLALLLTGVFGLSVWKLLADGVGVWGLNHPNVWGFDIVNYVWWIGLGNAGAIISGLLLLLGHGWRNALNRLAEAMTLFSAAVAGLFPILHLGRPWLFWWTIPHENALGLWPNFRSPLIWDAFAVMTYLGVVGLFWYVGLIPDLATLRDRAAHPVWRRVYGIAALGWRGCGSHWARWRLAYRTIAAVSVPYVVLIHTGVGLLYAGAPLPGWHSTVFPPLLMIGGTLAGFATIALLSAALRRGFGLADLITAGHLDLLAKIMLATALLYLYVHIAEIWTLLYRATPAELHILRDRVSGPFAPYAWAGWIGSIAVPQLFWLPAVRRRPWAVALVSAVIMPAVWASHYMLQMGPLSRGIFPAMWQPYLPTVWDWGVFAGSIGLFLLLLVLFLRAVPAVSIFEVKEALRDEREASA